MKTLLIGFTESQKNAGTLSQNFYVNFFLSGTYSLLVFQPALCSDCRTQPFLAMRPSPILLSPGVWRMTSSSDIPIMETLSGERYELGVVQPSSCKVRDRVSVFKCVGLAVSFCVLKILVFVHNKYFLIIGNS